MIIEQYMSPSEFAKMMGDVNGECLECDESVLVDNQLYVGEPIDPTDKERPEKTFYAAYDHYLNSNESDLKVRYGTTPMDNDRVEEEYMAFHERYVEERAKNDPEWYREEYGREYNGEYVPFRGELNFLGQDATEEDDYYTSTDIEVWYNQLREHYEKKPYYVYADYRDEMASGDSLLHIIEGRETGTAMGDFYNWVEGSCYDMWYVEQDAYKEAIEFLDIDEDKLAESGLEDEFRDVFRDTVQYDFDYDHFLNQEVCVDLILDCGDANYEFSTNSMYPAYGEEPEDNINAEYLNKSAVVWLAQQQGYSKEEFVTAMNEGCENSDSKFLKTMRQELAESVSQCSSLMVFQRMTFKEYFEMLDKTREAQMQGRGDEIAFEAPAKEVAVGLYNYSSGGGSILGVELEKPIRIPAKNIYAPRGDGKGIAFIPDDNLAGKNGIFYGYTVGDCYGMSREFWPERRTAKLEIEKPEQVKKPQVDLSVGIRDKSLEKRPR